MPDRETNSDLVAAAVEKWGETIAAFERDDAERRVARGQILFVGSSTMTRWALGDYFPRDDLVNRGFGGSQLCEVAALCERYVMPLAPRQIVLYAGDNDLGMGRSPEQVRAAYRLFVGKVRAEMPEVPILFLSIKPSPCRRHLIGAMREANRLVEAETHSAAGLEYLDVFEPMLSPGGEPRPELYVEDALHMSHEGYTLWATLIAPLLVE